jgi:predicted protein tyrosine phosphatase
MIDDMARVLQRINEKDRKSSLNRKGSVAKPAYASSSRAGKLRLKTLLVNCYGLNALRGIARRFDIDESGDREELAWRITDSVGSYIPTERMSELLDILRIRSDYNELDRLASRHHIPEGSKRELFAAIVRLIPEIRSRLESENKRHTVRSILRECFEERDLKDFAKLMGISRHGSSRDLSERIAAGMERGFPRMNTEYLLRRMYPCADKPLVKSILREYNIQFTGTQKETFFSVAISLGKPDSQTEVIGGRETSEEKKVLFVCSDDHDRSPTAAEMYASRSGLKTSHAGITPGASTRISLELLDWADIVMFMEDRHLDHVKLNWAGWYKQRKSDTVVLNIKDEYSYNQPELIELLRLKVNPILEQKLGLS